MDIALVSRYSGSMLDDPACHEVDTSQQFTAEDQRNGTVWFPTQPFSNRDKLYNFIYTLLKDDPAFHSALTILVLTDTRQLSGQEHWAHTARLIIERCRVVSHHGETWTPIFVPLNQDTGLEQIHFPWGGVLFWKP